MFKTDYHVHIDWNPEKDLVEKMEEYAREADKWGITGIGFVEHYWNRQFPGHGKWYIPADAKRMTVLRAALTKAKLPAGMHGLIGCETEFDKNGTIPMTEEDIRQMDYVIVPHSHINMIDVVTEQDFTYDPEGCARYMEESFMGVMKHPLARYITILAHPFAPVGLDDQQDQILSYISDERFRRCARAAKKQGIALEVNSLTWKDKTEEELQSSQYIRFYRIAWQEGCSFVFGSDAHGPEQYQYLPKAMQIARESGILRTEESMHNIP